MDSFEWNRIAGGVLGTALFITALNIASEAVFHVEPPANRGYVVEGVEAFEAGSGAGASAPEEEQIPDFALAIPAANIEVGEQVAKRCAQCHTWDKGGENKIGPNQYGIIGRGMATEPNFNYSAALQRHGGTWTYEELYRYLRSPARYIPGNKMAFAGLPRAQDRIDLLAYMRTWADTPPPLPPPLPPEEEASSGESAETSSVYNETPVVPTAQEAP